MIDILGEYQATLEEVMQGLSTANHACALDLARVPELIKGFGHVKDRHMQQARPEWAKRLAAWRKPEAAQTGAKLAA